MMEIEKRRAHPTDDFISTLLAREGSDQLSDEEVLGACYVTLIAGHDTTANTMALVTVALAEQPPARDFLRQHPEQIGDALMELMRYVSMSTVMGKIASADFDWHGHPIKKGDLIFAFQGAGNRDPSVFPDPDRLDLRRAHSPTRNLTFAPGLHHCIGHLMAKMQLEEFFPELLRRFDPEILDERLNWAPAMGFRGLDSLNLRMNPRM